MGLYGGAEVGRQCSSMGETRHPHDERPWCASRCNCRTCSLCIRSVQIVAINGASAESGSLLAGAYKIPTVNDVPVDFRVSLLQNAPNARAVHSSKAVGEPPFHLGASVLFAIKDAVYACRSQSGVHHPTIVYCCGAPHVMWQLISFEDMPSESLTGGGK